MQISPFENGAHSMAEGLKYLAEYLADPAKQYSLKGAIISIHHGIETLLKDALFQRNPMFILDDKVTIGKAISRYKEFYELKNNYIFDDELTIKPSEALVRTKQLTIGQIKERDYQSMKTAFDRLNTLRNQLQHFALRVDPQSIIKLFGDLIPKAIRYITTCYTFDVGRNEVYVLPHHPIRGMEHLFKGGDSLMPYLHKFYPDAEKLIDALQSKYDVMLNEAIEKFKNKTFSSIVQNLEIDSHGHIGAPPYYPSLKMDGWINEEFSSHENSVERYNEYRFRISSATYTGTVQIDEPIVLEKNDGHYNTHISQKINCSFELTVLDITKLISLDECADYIEFLRDAKITVLVELRFQAWAADIDTNYRIDEILNPEGEVVIHFSSGLFGDPKREPVINLMQTIPLSAKNMLLRFDGFGSSGNFLNHRHSLSLKANGRSDIISQ